MNRVILAVLIGLVVIAAQASATTIHVPADSATIQGGINGASNGDTVLVAEGIYYENIDFLSKTIVVASEDGAELTIIEKLSDSFPIVTFSNITGGVAILQGFTITNSTGGGIICENSYSTIKDNIISNNSKDGQGGGISLSNSSSFISNNYIINNNSSYDSHGGGIFLFNSSSFISNNYIINNNSGNAGGGISIWDSWDCEIKNNIIVKNQSTNGGGGIYSARTPNIEIINNTIDSNYCGNQTGSGILLEVITDALLQNNIVTNNYPNYGISASYSISIIYSNSYNNSPADYYQSSPGEGCISLDPLFVNPDSNDYNLQDSSPCIDTGDPLSPTDPDGTRADMGALWYHGTINLELFDLIEPQNNSLFTESPTNFVWQSTNHIDSSYSIYYNLFWDTNQNFTNPDSVFALTDTTYSMPDTFSHSTKYYWKVLAYDDYGDSIYCNETWNFYILGTWHISTFGNDFTGDGSEEFPFATIQHGIDMAVNGETVLVAPGTYQEHINFLGKAILVMSEEGAESTIISESNMASPLVSFNNNEDTTSKFIGFTVSNCVREGIFINSSPIVQSCTIKYNNNGGIRIYSGANHPYILMNSICHNSGGNIAGGIVIDGAHAIVDSNLIYNNSAEGGAGIEVYNGTMSATANIIYGNINTNDEGAVLIIGSSQTTLINNTIVNNEASGSNAGGIFISGSSNTILKNNIIAFNDLYGVYGNASMTYCCIYGNESGEYYDIIPGVGCIEFDPLFFEPEIDDYSLTGDSPCINTGDPSSPLNPDGSRADMGALYFKGISIFGLIFPQTDTILIANSINFIWQSASHIDSSYLIHYSLYWDTDFNFVSPDSVIGLIDTTYSMPDTFNRSTQYYWHVLAYDDYGDSTYSDETWNFYVDDYPTIPEIIDPDNGDFVDSSTFLIWLLSTDPDLFDTLTYTLQVDDNPLFNSPEIDVDGITDSGLTIEEAVAVRLGDLPGFSNLQQDQTYYWRIRSDDAFGLSSEYTDGSNYFSCGIDTINTPPNPPISGFSPANNEEVISLTPTIVWDDATDPDPDDNSDVLRYIFNLVEDTGWGGYVYWDTTDPGVNQVVIPDTLDDNSYFHYAVKTIDDEGLESGWSIPQSFWTNHYNYPPEPFPLYSPLADIKWVDYYSYFSWGSTYDYDPMSSWHYKFQISPDSLFNYDVYTIDSLMQTTLTMVTDTLALTGQILYWRVYAIDDDGLPRKGGIPEEERKLTIIPPGDANTDLLVMGSDVIYLVGYFKGNNPPPDPILAGDANGDCQLIGSDITRLISYFKGYNPLVRGDCEQAVGLMKGSK